jgi:hypothetical protein
MSDLEKRAESCGYTPFLEKYLKYPPDRMMPAPPQYPYPIPGCDL